MQFKDLQLFGQDQIDKQVNDNLKDILKEYEIAYKKIRRGIEGVYANNLAGIPKDQYYREMLKFDRLKSLENAILKTYNEAVRKAGIKTRQSSELAIANNFYWQQYAVNWVSPYSFTIIPDAVVNYSVTGRTEIIKNIKSTILKDQLSRIAPSSGMTLKELITKNRDAEVRRTFSAVSQGLISGDSVKTVSKEIRKIEDFSKFSAERIVRTESHRNREAGSYIQNEVAKANGVDSVRILLSVKDTRTRPQSVSVDGKRDTGKGFLYPNGNRYFVPGNTGIPAWDINDRETVINEVDGESPTIERARNPVTGENEIIQATSFREWAKSHGLEYNSYGKLIKKG